MYMRINLNKIKIHIMYCFLGAVAKCCQFILNLKELEVSKYGIK
jgi:hypothetical protein